MVNSRGMLYDLSEWLTQIDQSLDQNTTTNNNTNNNADDTTNESKKDQNNIDNDDDNPSYDNNNDESLIAEEEVQITLTPVTISVQMERGTSTSSLLSLSQQTNSDCNNLSIAAKDNGVVIEMSPINGHASVRPNDYANKNYDSKKEDEKRNSIHKTISSPQLGDALDQQIHADISLLPQTTLSTSMTLQEGDQLDIQEENHDNDENSKSNVSQKLMTEDEEQDVATNDSVECGDSFGSLDYELLGTDKFYSYNSTDIDCHKYSINCRGVVHVKVLKVKNLSPIDCPVGSHICAQIVLLPWKGKIRTEQSIAFIRQRQRNLTIHHKNDSLYSQQSISAQWIEPKCYQLLHAYNSEDTPMPTLCIDIMSCPTLALFETKVCTFRFPCEQLMQNPREWTRRWISVKENERIIGYHEFEEGSVVPNPFILVEALFEPSRTNESIEVKCNGSIGSVSTEGNVRERLLTEATPYSETLLDSPSRISPTRAESGRIERRNPSVNDNIARNDVSSPHLFRLKTFWTPSYCLICSSLLTILHNKGYRCEICNLDCCDECQLRSNLQLPCGSVRAKEAIKSSFQNRYTFSSILSVVAPEDKNTSQVGRFSPDIDADELSQLTANERNSSSIGILYLRLIRATLTNESLSPDFNIDDSSSLQKVSYQGQPGDYYMRISWTGSGENSLRTETIYHSSKPRFDGKDMEFEVTHYGMEFKLELVDAVSDKTVGVALLTTQGLLQSQRDNYILSPTFSLYSLLKPKTSIGYGERITKNIALRSGVKKGFGLDFFDVSLNPDVALNTSKKEEKVEPGRITGWAEIEVDFSERIESFYTLYPPTIPPRPPDDFKIDLIQLHFARLKSLIADIYAIFEEYKHITTWKDPPLSGFCFIVYIYSCFAFNMEYVGSIPFFWALIYMVINWRKRRSGQFSALWTHSECNTRRDASKKISTSFTTHRPLSFLEIAIQEGKNLASKELGIPGMFYATVSWDPSYFMSPSRKGRTGEFDATVLNIHDLGYTETANVSSNPIWNSLYHSDESLRLKSILSGANQWISNTDVSFVAENSFVYPILQPLKRKHHLDSDTTSIVLKPWHLSDGAVIIQIHNALNRLFDDCIGEAVVPFSYIVAQQNNQIEGWIMLDAQNQKKKKHDFSLIPKEVINENDDAMNHSQDETTDNISLERPDLNEEEDKSIKATNAFAPSSRPAIFISCAIFLPNDQTYYSDTERESSIVVAQEMIQTASVSRENIGMIGSSINTINTVRGMSTNAQWLQNMLGSFLDNVESTRNLFTWASPHKSALVFLSICATWITLYFIPTRVILFFVGMYEFVGQHVLFSQDPIDVLAHNSDDESNEEEDRNKQTIESIPGLTHLNNLIAAVPTDEDLRRAYFWQTRHLGGLEREAQAHAKRKSRLKTLWKALWYGNLKLKLSVDATTWKWIDIFAILQGHRLVWWESTSDFDTGKTPFGQILFAGHSGIAGLSPLDLRQLKRSELDQTIGIFGRGVFEQEKIILLAPSIETKTLFEELVIKVTEDPKKD